MSPEERALFEYANHERQSEHLLLFRWDPNLAAAARLHSDRMASENAISHQLAGEGDFEARAISAGARFNELAENVGEAGSVIEINIGWMNSPGHRANLMNPTLDSIGIGVAKRGEQFFATQDFSRAVQALTLDEQERKFGALIRSFGIRLESDSTDARRTCQSGDLDSVVKRATYRMIFVTADLASLPKKLKDEIDSGKYKIASVGACTGGEQTKTGMYRLAVLLY